jgi:hypothetical protein
VATPINSRSLANIMVSPEVRKENNAKMLETVRKKQAARYDDMWREAVRLGMTNASSRVLAKALETSPGTVRKMKAYIASKA